MFETILSKYIRQSLGERNILIPAQHGFRYGFSCDSQLTGLIQELAEIVDRKGEADAILLDFAKAFDVVPHHILIEKLSKLQLDARVVKWINNWLTDRNQRVRIGNKFSSERPVKSGVPQGSVLGPLLFVIFINDIADGISSKLRLFADDCIIYTTIKEARDCELLQIDLNKICDWVTRNYMKLNEDKSQLIKFTTKRSINQIKYNYIVNSTSLTRVKNVKYLGITVNSKLNWRPQIEKMVKKGTNSLNFVMRNIRGSSSTVKEMAYKSLVRPILEYACASWDPHEQCLIDMVEKVQRRAARKVLGKYGKRHSPTDMIEALKWDSLQNRRKQARLAAMYQIMTGKEAYEDLVKYTKKSKFRGRASNDLKLSIRSYSTNVGRYSFVGTTIPEWNHKTENLQRLPSTVEKFKLIL
jgi:ribonucleases P/MRP protein subunit RPP40